MIGPDYREADIRVKTKSDGFIKMFSDSLSNILNRFYDNKGILIDSIFKTKEQICSFIAGVYYRNGMKIDTFIYKIQLANSPKHQNCYLLLKQLGCKEIFFKFLRGIPNQYILYFKPTNELENYLVTIENENEKLNESYNNAVLDFFKDSVSRTELQKELLKTRANETLRIRMAFE